MRATDVLVLLLRQPELREVRTGRTYVPTGLTADGKLLLSRTDKPADVAWEVSSLEGFVKSDSKQGAS
jgi:hypothetical protein